MTRFAAGDSPMSAVPFLLPSFQAIPVIRPGFVARVVADASLDGADVKNCDPARTRKL
jgi:hypothetical protein